MWEYIHYSWPSTLESILYILWYKLEIYVKLRRDITQLNCQKHHLVYHERYDVNIASITATAYDQHIENRTNNSYCAQVYILQVTHYSEFASALDQRDEISKITGLIGSVTKSDTTCKKNSDPIMGQLEELEGHIFDILGPEAVSHVKANISAVQ